MRKVTFGGACSLDGFIARPDGAVDWLMWSDEVSEIIKDYWKNIDAMVMGRKTWDVAVANAPSKGSGSPYGDIETYVFSRTLEPGEREGITFSADDPGEYVRELKKRDGKEICLMGGGQLARVLFEAGVIDEIGFNIHPVLLGSGIPAFYEMSHQIGLELKEARPLKNGCVYVLYKVVN